ncbi:hypothetical protein C1J00_35690 [Streptomyces cahuitamycinicus]|uniref:Uncharacterized protein n=1 Tax=Streptomyces cahuitamycinicus TaxID=2070367 RepID=A0A2N8TEY3_9ACTN|nr:hypothetical protein C1J00_35690 [Streptomyces cahuitamycinicus]
MPGKDDDLPEVYKRLLEEVRMSSGFRVEGAKGAEAELRVRLAWEQLKAAEAAKQAAEAQGRAAASATQGLHYATWVLAIATIALVFVTIFARD